MCIETELSLSTEFGTLKQSLKLCNYLPLGGQDEKCWGTELVGSCTIKALYKHLTPEQGPHLPWNQFLKLPIPPKLSCFAWRLLQRGLNTRPFLHKILPSISSDCTCCRHLPETIDHIFIFCDFAKKTRDLSPYLSNSSHFCSIGDQFWHSSKTSCLLGIIILSYLCKSRNDYLFR